MHIYVAGPFRPYTDDNGETHQTPENIRKAAKVADVLFAEGHVAITPHLAAQRSDDPNAASQALTDEDWLERTRSMLTRCDAMMLVEGWSYSKGTAQEMDYAKEQGIPIYEYPDVPDLHLTEQRCPVQCGAFMEKIMQMYRVHLDKNADYSPLNVQLTGEVGLVTRLWDKMARLLALTGFRAELKKTGHFDKPKDPDNESIEDTYLDLANYGVIGDLLRRNKWGR